MSEVTTLEDILLVETSRRNTDVVADIVLNNPALFCDLFDLFAGNRDPVNRRAAWAMDIISEKRPEMILPCLDKIVDLLPLFGHDALKRHSLRILARNRLPVGERLAVLINTCFGWLVSPGEAVAVKVFCMEILYRISRMEPDLKKELADTIEWRMNEGTAGFKNRAGKLLRKLYREIEDPVPPI